MVADIGFLVALIVGIASAVAAVVMVWHGSWLEATACGFAFIACIVIAFWLAMSALLDGLDSLL